jgi:hypothetical protein
VAQGHHKEVEPPFPATPAAPGLAARALRAFYLATPLFAALDWLVGINVRTAFLEGSHGLKWAWYAGDAAAGLALWRWPQHAALVGLVESGASIAWLVIGVMTTYYRAIDQVAAGSVTAVPFTAEASANLVLSAIALIVSYVVARARLVRRSP